MHTRRTRTHRTRALPVAMIASGACLALTGMALGAQDGSPAGETTSLDRLTERLDMLERDNAHLRQEVEVLRAETRQEWLTEERATEMRSLVADVLSDSSSRTSLQDAAATGGWSPDSGFYLRSADNRFMLQVSGLLQARYMWSRTSNAGFANTGPGGQAADGVPPHNTYHNATTTQYGCQVSLHADCQLGAATKRKNEKGRPG